MAESWTAYGVFAASYWPGRVGRWHRPWRQLPPTCFSSLRCVQCACVQFALRCSGPPLPSSVGGPLLALRRPFPLGGRCTGRHGEEPWLPRTPVPVRRAVRGEVNSKLTAGNGK